MPLYYFQHKISNKLYYTWSKWNKNQKLIILLVQKDVFQITTVGQNSYFWKIFNFLGLNYDFIYKFWYYNRKK